MWLQPSAIVLMMVLQTCVAERFERLERRLELKLKSFQASVEVRLDATEGYFDTLADRVSKLESIVDKSDTDIVLTRIRDHIANETESLEVFKTSILQDVNETRARVQNETTELEKKVEKLIGKANEVVGIIDEQRSTIEDGIMVTIRALPGVVGLHGPTVLSHVKAEAEVDTGLVMYTRLLLMEFALEMIQIQRNASFTSFV
ncbi:hypothetical protein MAR_033706, partial [Mya arenaria]